MTSASGSSGRLDADGDPEVNEWLRSVVLEERGAAGTRLRLRAWAPGGKSEGSMTATMVIGLGGSGSGDDNEEDDKEDATVVVEAPRNARAPVRSAARPVAPAPRGPCPVCAALARTVAGLREDRAALQGKLAGLVDGAANQDRKIGQVVGAYRELRDSQRTVRGDVEEMAVAIAALADAAGA